MITSKTDLNKLARDLQAEVLKLHDYVDSGFRSAVTEIFTAIVEGTPQYSGQLATNWHISSEAGEAAVIPVALSYPLDAPYGRGDEPAVTQALDRAKATIAAARYGSSLYVSNPVMYMLTVDEGSGPYGLPLRPENLIGGEVVMLRMNVTHALQSGWRS